jgi:2-dehydropantoate 2-reductase
VSEAPAASFPPARILVYGAGVLGTLYAARLHDAGNDVELVARGTRLAALREHGVRLAEGESGDIRSVPVTVVEHPRGRYDLTLVFVRTHQVDDVLAAIAGLGGDGDVLFLLNWAGGPEPLGAVIGRERVLLGFANNGGTMDGDVVRYRPDSALTRFVRMPIGEPDGRATARVERIVQTFRSAGIGAKAEPRMDAWLKTHAAFEVPLGLAVHAAGGPDALAGDADAIRSMVLRIRQNLGAVPAGPVPRAFGALRVVPVGVLVGVFRRFLRSSAAGPLRTDTPAVRGELARLEEQLREVARVGRHPSPGSQHPAPRIRLGR